MELIDVVAGVEKVSAGYCQKFNIERNNEWFLLKIQEELGELVQCYLESCGKARSRGNSIEELENNFQNELIDLLCLTMAMTKYNNLDLERVINEKWLKWL
jgi:NTP pyrophosphatase (non-canonical NTP hydrolase)